MLGVQIGMIAERVTQEAGISDTVVTITAQKITVIPVESVQNDFIQERGFSEKGPATLVVRVAQFTKPFTAVKIIMPSANEIKAHTNIEASTDG